MRKNATGKTIEIQFRGMWIVVYFLQCVCVLKVFVIENLKSVNSLKWEHLQEFFFCLLSVVPDAIRIVDENGVTVENATKLKTVDEGTTITLRCEAHGGRPIPSVTWQKNGKVLKSEYARNLLQFYYLRLQDKSLS